MNNHDTVWRYEKYRIMMAWQWVIPHNNKKFQSKMHANYEILWQNMHEHLCAFYRGYLPQRFGCFNFNDPSSSCVGIDIFHYSTIRSNEDRIFLSLNTVPFEWMTSHPATPIRIINNCKTHLLLQQVSDMLRSRAIQL